jgi:hypothetical protein
MRMRDQQERISTDYGFSMLASGEFDKSRLSCKVLC